MPKLSSEQQCALDMMQIVGFPMEIKHGLYTWERSIATPQGFLSRAGLISTSDFNRAWEAFNIWKENRNED